MFTSQLCSHQNKRIDILATLFELDQEKIEFQDIVIEKHNEYQTITEFYDQQSNLQLLLEENILEKQEDLMNDIKWFENCIEKIESKEAKYMEMYNDGKTIAMKEKCSCVDWF